MNRVSACAILATAGLAIASCSSPSGTSQSSTTSKPQSSTSTSNTNSRTVPTSTASTSSTSSSAASASVNVPITNQIRGQLVDAGAALNNIPASEYSGLTAGLTYYAFDKLTNTYWAGAQLVPIPSNDPSNPTQAQVGSQDDGSYYVFIQSQGGTWTAHAVGSSSPNNPCSITVPAEVLAVWGWSAGSCKPPGA